MLQKLNFGITGLAILMLAGCVQQVVDGDKTVYSVAIWVPCLTAGFGLAVFLYGLWFAAFRNPRNWCGYPIMALGLIGGGFMTWIPLRDQTIVDPQHFEIHAGNYHHSVQFAELESINVRRTESTDSKGRLVQHYYFDCRLKTGKVAQIAVGGDVAKAALPQIVELCRSKAIPITNDELIDDLLSETVF